MNGEFHLRDLQQFTADIGKLEKIVSEISSINQCISNPTCGAARHKVGDTKNEFSDEEVRQILNIQVKPKIRTAKEYMTDIKSKYGVTILIPEDKP